MANTMKPADRICNLVPSKDTEKDWSFETALASGALTAPAALPASVDLRDPSWWAVGDQEDTGSCVGWATGDGVMRYLLVKAGRLAKTKKVSPRYVWMASKETDEFQLRPESYIEGAGTSLKAACDICRKYGVALDFDLPFKINSKMFTGDENVFYASAALRKAALYTNIQLNMNSWKTTLASGTPILAGLNVDASWDNAAANHGLIDTFQPSTIRGGHAIAIVGYRADGRFIVRNSWGTGWGDQGFGYISPAYIQAGFFNEAYALVV